jgi:hypothetical protein
MQESSSDRMLKDVWSVLTRLILLRGEPVDPLTHPAEVFWDDLIAANRLKIYLLGNGVDVSKDVEDGLADLTARYGPPASAKPKSGRREDEL